MDDTWLTHALKSISPVKTQILVVKTQILVAFLSSIFLAHIKAYTTFFTGNTVCAISNTARELFSAMFGNSIPVNYSYSLFTDKGSFT
jgi:hypothetical protein